MHIDGFMIGMIFFIYYVISMIVGISTLEDMKDNYLYRNKSSFFKIWYYIFFTFIYTQVILTPFKFLVFLVSIKQQKAFSGVLKMHTSGK